MQDEAHDRERWPAEAYGWYVVFVMCFCSIVAFVDRLDDGGLPEREPVRGETVVRPGERLVVEIGALIYVIALIVPALFFFLAGRQKGYVPSGVRNAAEAVIGFVEKQIVLPTMGHEGAPFVPLIVTLFSFIFVSNIFEVIPAFQMPGNARMAAPLVLALTVWVVFIAVGIKHQGLLHYFKGIMFPPGVPKPIYLLLTPIELVSTIIVRPFSLAIRLFANMLAGHMLLVTFALLSEAMFQATTKKFVLVPMGVLPMFMLIFLTVFEVLVGFLQAYIFTILTAVYIGGAMHPEH